MLLRHNEHVERKSLPSSDLIPSPNTSYRVLDSVSDKYYPNQLADTRRRKLFYRSLSGNYLRMQFIWQWLVISNDIGYSSRIWKPMRKRVKSFLKKDSVKIPQMKRILTRLLNAKYIFQMCFTNFFKLEICMPHLLITINKSPSSRTKPDKVSPRVGYSLANFSMHVWAIWFLQTLNCVLRNVIDYLYKHWIRNSPEPTLHEYFKVTYFAYQMSKFLRQRAGPLKLRQSKNSFFASSLGYNFIRNIGAT